MPSRNVVVVLKSAALTVLATGCASLSVQRSATAEPTLKDAYRRYFLVGAALGNNLLRGNDPEAAALVVQQFNTVSPENALKWSSVHPKEGVYTFELADAYVAFAEANGLRAIGHTLVWHSQVPDRVFQDAAGQPCSREVLLERMREHIHTVVTRYRGRIHGWDVVNEAVADSGAALLRETPWRQIIGDDYVEKAFEFAREADPRAELYYNDYNLAHPRKREKVVRLIRQLKAKGIRVDAVGMQGHYHIGAPSIGDIEASIKALSRVVRHVNFTEVDISVYTYGQKAKLYEDGAPPELLEAQAARYAELFRVFRKHHRKIGRITFWGVTDRHSWRNYIPVHGRKDYPLLFDREGNPKPAFHAVVERG